MYNCILWGQLECKHILDPSSSLCKGSDPRVTRVLAPDVITATRTLHNDRISTLCIAMEAALHTLWHLCRKERQKNLESIKPRTFGFKSQLDPVDSFLLLTPNQNVTLAHNYLDFFALNTCKLQIMCDMSSELKIWNRQKLYQK